METFFEMLVPIGICVVLPIMIVWLVTRTKSRSIDKKTEVLLKALENGQQIDPELLITPKQSKNLKTIKMVLLEKLQVAAVFTLMGVAMIVLSSVGILGDTANVGFPVFMLCGVIFSAIGVGHIVVYVLGKQNLKAEMDAELREKESGNK